MQRGFSVPSGVSVTINRKYVQNYNQGVGLQLLSKTIYLPALMFITAALYDKLIRDVTGFLSEKLLMLARSTSTVWTNEDIKLYKTTR